MRKALILDGQNPVVVYRNPERAAYSVEEFCRRNNICKATLYAEIRAGRGPRTFKVRGRRIITADAERDWHAAREAATPQSL